MYPLPATRMVVPVSALLVEMIGSSMPDGVLPVSFCTETFGASVSAGDPSQSRYEILTGMVLLDLKMLIGPVWLIGCWTPPPTTVKFVATALELSDPAPRSS